MSRIGKLPVSVPSGVKVAVNGREVLIEGPLGRLQYGCAPGIGVSVEGGKIIVTPTGQDKQSRANFGPTRAILNNMVLGVSKGWKRSLEINGVGYSAKVEGKDLVLTVGYSHDVRVLIPESVVCKLEKNSIQLESPDRALLGDLAARIRKVQPPEPYLGKGIKYTEETIKRKAGKTAK